MKYLKKKKAGTTEEEIALQRRTQEASATNVARSV